MTLTITESQPVVLQLPPVWGRMGDREFADFCRLNPDLRIEHVALDIREDGIVRAFDVNLQAVAANGPAATVVRLPS